MLRIATLILCLSPLVASAADTAQSRMQAFSNGLQSVSATFEQEVIGARGTSGEIAKGTLALQAPRQFRWETISPYAQLIVADGARVWIHDPDLEQVTVRIQSFEEAHSPLTVLTDLSQLEREFSASESGERDGLLWLKLVSRSAEPDFAFAELGFDARNLVRMRFEDQLGNVTEMRFSDWQRNPTLAPDAFRFTPPPGVDVIGDVGTDAEVFPVKD